MTLIDKLGAKEEAEAFYSAVDGSLSPTERDVIISAGEHLLWAVAWRVLVKLGLPIGAVAVIGLTIFGSQATGVTPPGVAADEVNIVARAPGTDPKFALNFCNDPATTVARPRFPVPEASGQLVASRGTDTLTWQGPGTVTALYETKDSSTPIDITPDAVACLTRKVK